VLTVFIATHNGGRDLARTLASYTRLHPPDGGWKLVVIDNASEDDSLDVARSFDDRLPLVCVAAPVRGKNRALNRALGALDGDLAVFADDDGLPDPDWLVAFRAAADSHPDFDAFGGAILPLWMDEPAEWLLEWVELGPVYSLTGDTPDGPCEPNRVWGPNMAVRASAFHKGYRFDERIGPDGSRTYAMGSETEFLLRLAFAEKLRCWHCAAARVRHVVAADTMRPGWIFTRAFRLGRCLYREAQQKRAAGCRGPSRDPAVVRSRLADSVADLAAARSARDPRGVFEARWQMNIWMGCLFEAARASVPHVRSIGDAARQR
jgi:glycosyltransferase involved in cell wall biosynthesis